MFCQNPQTLPIHSLPCMTCWVISALRDLLYIILYKILDVIYLPENLPNFKHCMDLFIDSIVPFLLFSTVSVIIKSLQPNPLLWIRLHKSWSLIFWMASHFWHPLPSPSPQLSNPISSDKFQSSVCFFLHKDHVTHDIQSIDILTSFFFLKIQYFTI